MASWMSFLYGVGVDAESQTMLELFDSFGSASFTRKYFEVTSVLPVPVVNSALNTFACKVIAATPGSGMPSYYLRKHQQYGEKLRRNLQQAVSDSKDMVFHDQYGITSVKFFTDLFR